MIHRYMTLREIAEAMNVSAAWLYNNHQRLEREFGFPAPAPGFGARRDALAIEAWQNRGLPLGLQSTIPAEPASLEHWQTELDRRAEHLT